MAAYTDAETPCSVTANTASVVMQRQRDKRRPLTVVPRVVSVYTTRGGHRLLLIVRCECGWHHQHTAAPSFAEGVRKGGCGRRYVLRVAAARSGAAA